MSSPHVAGAVALYLNANPNDTPAQVASALASNASVDKIALHSRSQANNTPNRLLYTAFIGGGGPLPNQPPAAGFTPSCTNLACGFTDTSTDSDGTVTAWSWAFGDGTTSTAQSPNHTYTAAGTYTVTLTVTDDDGATDTASQTLTVNEPGPNAPPAAGFTASCTDLACGFTDTSTDSDGTVTGWSWSFGDGATSTAQNPSHTYAAAGTYTVTLTATDNEGASDTATQSVTVTDPPANTAPVASFTSFCDETVCEFTDTSTDAGRDGRGVELELELRRRGHVHRPESLV